MNKFSKMKVHSWTYNHCLFVSYLTSVVFEFGWVSDTVEFALHPQHETSCDSEIQTKKDCKSKFRKQLGISPTTSLIVKAKKKHCNV